MSNSKNSDQLALIMQYTCYHMVIYVGLIAAFASNTLILPNYILIIAGVSFIPSCIATGVIAANLPYYKNFEEFKKEGLKLSKFEIGPSWLWSGIENYGFWAGMITVFVGYIFNRISLSQSLF
jgi:hypothetical protein